MKFKADKNKILFKDINEVIFSRTYLGLDVHEAIKLWVNGKVLDTTVGRAIFNDHSSGDRSQSIWRSALRPT